jgi:VWFA-related protein
MRRSILSLTAALLLFELILDSSVSGVCQAPEKDTSEKDFGYSLADIPTKRVRAKTRDSPRASQSFTSAGVDDGLVRVNTDLVISEVAVLDKAGHLITGLGRNDFAISEEEQPQKIEIFSSSADSAIPRSIVLIFDYSDRMLPYIETSVEAAKVLIDKLKPTDRLALVTDDVEVISGFTSDKPALKEKLDQLKMKALGGKVGESRQYSSLWAVLKELFNEGTLRPIVIFQTDGDQIDDFLRQKLNSRKVTGTITDNSEFPRILDTIEESRATIYAVAPGPSYLVDSRAELLRNAELDLKRYLAIRGSFATRNTAAGSVMVTDIAISTWANARRRDMTAMSYVSQFSGGSIEHLTEPGDAEEVYSRILSNMNQRYVIGYYPTNQLRDGTRRRISITFRGRSDYRVHGRKSYVAPLDR